MKISLDVDMNKFRYSLVGDGYIFDEIINMTDDQLSYVLEKRIHDYIEKEYDRSLPIIQDHLG